MDGSFSEIPAAAMARGRAPASPASAAPAHAPVGERSPDPGIVRVETAQGRPVSDTAAIDAHWHRPPYAMSLRLVRYRAGTAAPEVMDEAVIGTRGDREGFRRHVRETADRLMRDAIAGRSRGRGDGAWANQIPWGGSHAGWFDYWRARWSDRLFTEWWSLGVSQARLPDIIRGGALGDVVWLNPEPGTAYLADPFPWAATGEILCEEMPVAGGAGRIVAIAPGKHGRPARTIIADGQHRSYPCTFVEDGVTYLLPESTVRGGTMLYRLETDGGLSPVCQIGEGRRMADATLFRRHDLYWIAFADADIGAHESLCLLHAESLRGPWRPHRLDPVRIDVRGARPAGGVFEVDGVPYRPGQNCAAGYGAGITIHRIDRLTPDQYHETAVAAVRPNPTGPFPDGLHTLVHDGTRVWVDGKRLVVDWGSLARKAARRLPGRFRSGGEHSA